MTNNIGPIIGAGLSIVALGVTAKIATDLVKETGKKAGMKKTKTLTSKPAYASNQALYKKIWG